MIDYHVIREALRLERERRDLSLDDLAALAGVNRATIHSIENLKREPKLKSQLPTIEKLAAAMEMTVSLSLIPNRGLQTQTGTARVPIPLAGEEGHATTAPLADSISLTSFERAIDRLGSTLQRSIVEGIRDEPKRKRKAPARSRAKSKIRAKDRNTARRRA